MSFMQKPFEWNLSWTIKKHEWLIVIAVASYGCGLYFSFQCLKYSIMLSILKFGRIFRLKNVSPVDIVSYMDYTGWDIPWNIMSTIKWDQVWRVGLRLELESQALLDIKTCPNKEESYTHVTKLGLSKPWLILVRITYGDQ